MLAHPRATTAAPLTPPGRGGIAVVRLAGPRCGDIIAAVFRPLRPPAAPDELALGWLVDPADGATIDQVLVTRDGEAAEINLHGGPAVEAATLDLLAAQGAEVVAARGEEGFRPAHPRWANPAVGREMLRRLPHARSLLAAAALSAQWSDGLSRLAREQVENGPDAQSRTALRAAADGLGAMRRLLDPAEVVIAGPPNAGKSALANALVGGRISIVHDRPGTTRDWVREPAVLDGVPVSLTDTAGLWHAEAPVDAEAVRRARHRAERADLVLLASKGARADVPDWLDAAAVLRVATKADAVPVAGPADIAVSTVTGAGLRALRRAVVAALGLADFDARAPAAFTKRQQRLLLRACEASSGPEPGDAPAALKELLCGRQDARP
ncbi:MAG: GTPase [Planctomycetota bacterium]